MYVFGGWNGKEYFSDVCTFDLEKMVWNRQDLLVVLNQTTWLQLLRMAGLLPDVPRAEAIGVNTAEGTKT